MVMILISMSAKMNRIYVNMCAVESKYGITLSKF